MIEALDIHVTGIVQGVGFRPFVYRMAKKYLINGWVLNATDGVFIHAEGEGKLLDEFVLELSENPPAAAHVSEITLKEVPLEDFTTFEIRFSDDSQVEKTTLVSPDMATCDDCLTELFDPQDRRYRYPFINCTNCGPRFTIIDKLPYDRKNTSMTSFPMCEACAAEYRDPADRRFHAQPDACFECGPHISFVRTDGEIAHSSHGQSAGSVDTASPEELRPEGDHDDPDVVTIGGKSFPLRWGTTRQESDSILAEAVDMLLAGKILAVKGLGGFHLVCDANNAHAVATLRRRKQREGKAFAVMLPDVEAVRELCLLNEVEQAQLQSSERPIVLLAKRPDASFVPGLADRLSELGVMLPYTPLQHLLMHDFALACRGWCGSIPSEGAGGKDGTTCPDRPCADASAEYLDGDGRHSASERPVRCETSSGASRVDATPLDAADVRNNPPMLVMTSGNIHDEPIVIDDVEAYEKLGCIADGFIGNDRPIRTRFDDSVIRVIKAGSSGYAVQMIRRARGFAPAPEKLSVIDNEHPPIFAAGPEQKNTFALLRDDEVFVSQHIGDMENADTYDAWLAAKRRFEDLFEVWPEIIACDTHPEYLTTKWALEQDLPLTQIQHHHAHVAAAMAEHGISDAVCGIAFDGTGYGVDGTVWGGEVLLSNLSDFERFANFVYVPMPGGAACIRHPLRMAYGVLWAFDLLDHPGARPVIESLGEQADICDRMIEKSLNTPMTSSVGRLFDAASAILGVCVDPLYEGEPAMALEAEMELAGADVPGVQLYESLESSLPAHHADQLEPTKQAHDADQSAQMDPSVDADGFRSDGDAVDSGVGTEGGDPYGMPPLTDSQAVEGEQDASSYQATASSMPGMGEGEFGRESELLAKERYAIRATKNTATAASTAQDTSVVLFDAEPTFRAMLDDMVAGVPKAIIIRRFHDAISSAIVMAAQLVRAMYGISTVVLTGGVFMNRYLISQAISELEQAGFTVVLNRELPPNDGCISLGQAVVAWSRNKRGDLFALGTASSRPEQASSQPWSDALQNSSAESDQTADDSESTATTAERNRRRLGYLAEDRFGWDKDA